MTRDDEPIKNVGTRRDAFSDRNQIFSKKRRFSVGYVLRPMNIVARNEEIRRLATALNTAVTGDGALVILNEIGRFKGNDLLLQLTRAEETGNSSGTRWVSSASVAR